MNQHSSTLPPEPRPKRERIFSMRLTDAEREVIETLARRLNMPDSTLARHFVLEAVAFHSHQSPEEQIEWRDGTTSTHGFRTKRTKYTLTQEEADKLIGMIHDQRPQWEILREFPGLNWQGVVNRLYHHGNRARIGEIYHQPRKYTYKQTWYDTEEYQQGLSMSSSREHPSFRQVSSPVP